MLDRDVRRALRQQVESEHSAWETKLVDELGLCYGATRVDVAAINGKLIGYEIKSERDTLARLAYQRDIYNRTLDEVVIVCAGKHAEGVARLVPDWWGIRQAIMTGGEVLIDVIRSARPNPGTDPASVVQLLWREEMVCGLGLLRGTTRGLSKRSKDELAGLTVAELGDLLGDYVRYCLKTRPGWGLTE